MTSVRFFGSHRATSSLRRRAGQGLLAVTMVAAVLVPGQAAHAAQSNLARAGSALSTDVPCTLNSGPGKAIDGKTTNIYYDKWCAYQLAGLPMTLTINLPPTGFGGGYTISQIVVRHAGSAGESPLLNTRDFSLSVYNYFWGWTRVATVTGNTANVSVIPVPVFVPNVVGVQLTITNPQTWTGTKAARIFEVEVWGDFTCNLEGGPGCSGY